MYTNTPCFGCQIRGNYLASDPAVYGCLYHDGHAGAAGLWNDRENVFENTTSHVVYSPQDHTTVTDIWYNNSDCAWLGNTTNRDVRDADGKCANVSIVNINGSDTWPAPAAAIIANAGRRIGELPEAVAPAISPPSPSWPPSKNYTPCNNPAPGPPGPPRGQFTTQLCRQDAAGQSWELSPGVVPGDEKITNVRLHPLTAGGCAHNECGCWEIEACATGDGARVSCNWGCKAALPSNCKSDCDCNGAWSLNGNGTITSMMDGKCLQVSGGKGSAVDVAKCTGDPASPRHWLRLSWS